MVAGTEAEIDDIGFFTPLQTPVEELHAGEVGYLITGIKDVSSLRVGDTLTIAGSGATEPLPGYREVKPMVFCGLFPMNNDDYPELRDALEKLELNDAALMWEPETSDALGFGFRCGFLGLLHMDIVRERLEREYDLELMATMPSVEFEVTLTDGTVIPVHNPTDMPDPVRIAEVREPYIRASILAPKEFIGQIMELCQERRGTHQGMHYLSSERVQITYDLPLAEIVLDFFDQLKTRTQAATRRSTTSRSGCGRRTSSSSTCCSAGDVVDALSMVVHRDKAYDQGKVLTERLRKKIPRQQYDVPIQAAVGAKIIARETVKAFRKDVTAKCYGGDITPQAQAAGEAEGGQAADEAGRPDRGAAGGVPGGARAGEGHVTRATYAVGREKVREYAHAVGETDPRYLDPEAARAAGFADVVAPPMFAAVYCAPAIWPALVDPEVGIDFARMVHGAQEFTWGAPVVAGDEITTEAELDESSERGGLQFFVFKTTSTNQRGELVSEGRWTNIVR